MNKEDYKNTVQQLIEKSKKKGLIKTYSEFLETDEAKLHALTKKEVKYYTSMNNKNI